MDIHRLESLLACFPTLTLLVAGDYFLDQYLEIDAACAETSLETGLEAHQVVRIRSAPGAAGTVTSNLRALGVQVIALGILGDDGNGYELKRALASTGVDIRPLVASQARCTPAYIKPLRDGRELNRIDIKNRAPLPRNLEAVLRRYKKVVVPEMNMGQLVWVLRARFLLDAEGLNKIQGKPFKQSEIEAKIEEVLG